MLCCVGFIGFAGTISAIISDHAVQDKDDDQLYYTQLYLDQEKRVRISVWCVSGVGGWRVGGWRVGGWRVGGWCVGGWGVGGW